MKEIKLLHLANHMHHVLFEQRNMIGGFYNWHLVFQQPNNFVSYTSPDVHNRIMSGEFNTILFGISRPEMVADTINNVREIAAKYNLQDADILARSTGQAFHLIEERKKIDKEVKIVAHVDYAIQLWHTPMLREFFNPRILSRILSNVDYIFTAEPFMGEWLYSLLGQKRDVYFIPHPTNTFALKQIRENLIKSYGGKQFKENSIRAIIHRYDNNWAAPFVVLDFLDKTDLRSPIPIYVAMDGNQQFVTELRSFGCDYVEVGTPHEAWIEKLARTRILIDSYHNINTYGRSPVECACLGTPIVGSSATYLQSILFPDTTSEPNSLVKQIEDVKKLLSDEDFYLQVCKKAYNKVEEFNYLNSRNKFEGMLNGTLEPKWKAK